MHDYADSLTVGEALQVYFSRYHFENGGYDLRYFRIKLGPVYLPVPNTKGRIAAVKMHDIHHVLTGYTALWKGETEIGAWEIASGCSRYFIAWLLNFGSFSVGLLLFPRALYRAFQRGRQARTNLYHGFSYDEQLLNSTLGTVRAQLGIDESGSISIKDRLLFAAWSLASLLGMSLLLSAAAGAAWLVFR